MNRRSFLKVIGVGGGSIATFALTPIGLNAMREFTEKTDQNAAQRVLSGVEDYRASSLVRRVPTSKTERAILMGLEHHTDVSQIVLIKIDASMGQINGQAYATTGYGVKFIPCTFSFYLDHNAVVSNFDYMMGTTKQIARSITSFSHHLEADPDMYHLMARNSGVNILPVF